MSILAKIVISIFIFQINCSEVVKDKYGNIIYTLSTDFSGNILKKDKYGNLLGTYKKDYNGYWVYYSN